jgi:ubiquinone/menaquinone biosynthesis C-methylase UbiE
METLKWLRILGDPSRLRALRLLSKEELSVAELQEILGMGQSRISMQLSQLKQADLVEMRRSGQRSLYSLSSAASSDPLLNQVLAESGGELPESGPDDRALALVLDRRKDHLRSYFDDLAGKFGRSYVPGRSWKALSEMLMRLLPPLVIADLGAGEGTLSLMLSQRAKRVIAVDSARKMVEYGAGVAERHGIENLEYRVGDLEELPIAESEVDLALLHQSLHHALHPDRALCEAFRILRPGGRVVVMDLLKHDFDAARELYADTWLGFSQSGLLTLLESAGFTNIDLAVVDRESEPPHFEILMALAGKPA